MKRLFRRGSSFNTSAKGSTPEAKVTEAVRKFCDSGAPNNPNAGGDEVTHLPTIVEGAESSPQAAAAAAYKIRKLLSDGYSKPYLQYNSVMLMRILTDNPGPQFTRNIDSKFILTIKTCLQQSKDPSVQQILCETLYYFSSTKSSDSNLGPLLNMWQQEQRAHPANRTGGNRPSRPRSPPNTLPPPGELAARVSEARSSAQLLIQLSESTPPAEVPNNELMKEFAERVQSANRNLQAYMNCQDPAPDEHTFRTLIEVCDQLNIASSRHQRAVLAARQQFGLSNRQSAIPNAPPVQSRDFQQQPMQGQQAQQQRNSFNPSTQANTPQNQRSSFTQQAPPVNIAPPQPPRPTRTIESGTQNPFSDDARIAAPMTQRQSQVQPVVNGTYSSTNTRGNPRSSAGVFELPGTVDEDFAPPSGPPPGKSNATQSAPQNLMDDDDDDYDLYNTGNTPVADRYPPQNSSSAFGTTNSAATNSNITNPSSLRSTYQNTSNSPISQEGAYNYSPQGQTQERQLQSSQPLAQQARPDQLPQVSPQTSAQQQQYPQTSSQPLSQVSSQSSSQPLSQTISRPLSQNQLSQYTQQSQRPDLTQSAPSYVQRQDDAAIGMTMHGGSSPPPSSSGRGVNRGVSGKIKDDEPMTPSGVGLWR